MAEPDRKTFERALTEFGELNEGLGRLLETPVAQWGAPDEADQKQDQIEAAWVAVWMLVYGHEPSEGSPE